MIHNVLIIRLTMLPTWQNVLQTRSHKHPEMLENSKTGYTFSTRIPKPVESKGILGHLSGSG